MLLASNRLRGHLRRLAAPFSSDAPEPALPARARAVVVGGGIIGNSVAYHLARQPGWAGEDVILLEQAAATSGTTWHAAGLMATFGSTSESATRLRQYSQHLYRDVLEEETGQATGFAACGFIELASNPDRLEEYRRVADFNRYMGIDVQEISPQEVRELFPLCRVDDIEAGFYVAGDGRVNPVDVTMALAKGARMRGAALVEGVRVADTLVDRGRCVGVRTAGGQEVRADVVVNCAGMWARQLAQRAGVAVPNQAAEHYYLITDAMPEVDPSWPVIEDPSSWCYVRPEGQGLMVGLFEGAPAPWAVDRVPEHFSFGEIEPDWDRIAPFLADAMARVPATEEVGMKKLFCGPESFTPDLGPALGEAPELPGYWVAAGLNSIGITTGGGVGRLMAHWIANGRADMDVTGFNIDRFQPYQALNPRYREDRAREALGNVYKCHYPYRPLLTGRDVKRTPFHDRLAARGAHFNATSGWEAPDYFGDADVGDERLAWRDHPFLPNWEREHRACREGVIAMDMSFMSKFVVAGRDAARQLNRLCTADVDADGMITYTQMLNEDGRMEADVTVAKLGGERFLVIATDTAHRHVETWLRRNLDGERCNVFVADVTGAYGQLNVQGPHSRALLQSLTDTDLSDQAFPFRTAREIAIGSARVLCVRITYLGELGYELHVPAEFAGHVFDRVAEAGGDELVFAGLKALGSLRMEKGYKDYGHDMDNTDTLLEVGLGFTADLDKEGGFLGRDTVVQQKESGVGRLPRRMVQVLCQDPWQFMYHGEILLRDGVPVGDVRAASYGHTLGGAVGLAMVEKPDGKLISKKWFDAGDWEVLIAGARFPAQVSLAPLYDPKNERIKS